MTKTETKKRIELNRGELIKFRLLAKWKRIQAEFQNRITRLGFDLLKKSGNAVTLDDSKTEWKIRYPESMFAAEFVFEDQLIATVIPCDNPRTCDLKKLESEFPEAFAACVTPNGQHLRLNIKK